MVWKENVSDPKYISETIRVLLTAEDRAVSPLDTVYLDYIKMIETREEANKDAPSGEVKVDVMRVFIDVSRDDTSSSITDGTWGSMAMERERRVIKIIDPNTKEEVKTADTTSTAPTLTPVALEKSFTPERREKRKIRIVDPNTREEVKIHDMTFGASTLAFASGLSETSSNPVRRERKAIKIVDPNTMDEVKIGNMYSTASTPASGTLEPVSSRLTSESEAVTFLTPCPVCQDQRHR